MQRYPIRRLFQFAVLAPLAGGSFGYSLFDYDCAETATCLPPSPETLGPEICGNAMDDDGNGLLDCADDACSDACLPTMPAGWEGFFWVSFNAPSTPTPAYPEGMTQRTFYEVSTENPSCSSCSCQTDGVVRPGASIGIYPDNSCQSSPMMLSLPDGCSPQPASSAYKAANLIQSAASGGCSPVGGVLLNVPIERRVDVCRQNAETIREGICSPGSVCTPVAVLAPSEQRCIMQQGDTPTCPSGWPAAHVVHESFIDKRACTPCTCGPPACVGQSANIYSDPSCQGSSSPVQGCTSVSSIASASWAIHAQPAHPQCTPYGGNPTGQINPQNPVTFCCL